MGQEWNVIRAITDGRDPKEWEGGLRGQVLKLTEKVVLTEGILSENKYCVDDGAWWQR